jgi:hypothetical protein
MQFISAIVAAAVGGLLVVFFQDPIAEYVNSDRLVLEVHPGPWSPLPPERGDAADAWERQGADTYAVTRILAGDTVHVARIDLRNPGRHTIDQIRLAFGEHGPFAAMILDGGEVELVRDPAELVLRSLAPGEKLVVYVWSIFDLSSTYSFRDWHAYSSQGSGAIRIFTVNREQFREPVANFMDHQLPGVVFGLLIVALFLFVLVFAFVDQYMKQLLSDDAHYTVERERYRKNPSAFNPSLRP